MKSTIRFAWIFFCMTLLGLFIISSFSSFIAPAAFSYITLFALAFPYLFLLMVIAIVINFFTAKRLAVFMLICLPPGLYNLSHTIAFNLPGKIADKKNDSTLRIMTWNVQDFVNLSFTSEVRSKMLNIISTKQPDVLCIQEMTDVEGGKWRVSIRKELDSIGYKYHFFSKDIVTTNSNDAIVTRGVAIFSRQPLIDSGSVAIRNDDITENLIYTNINFNNRLLRIYTAHLASFQLYVDTENVKKDVYQITYDRKRAIQYKLREVEELHQHEAEIIHEELSKAGFPAVYCGDMNAVPCSYNYRLIKGNLQDAFIAKGSGIGATFYKILPTLRIDYCLADRRLNVNNCTVITEKLSDHYPVITDMQWK